MEARYRGIFDASSAGLFILDAQGALLHANPAMRRLFALAAEDAAACDGPAFLATLDRDGQGLAALVASARDSGQTQSADLMLKQTDGQALWLHCVVSRMAGGANAMATIEGVVHDITDRKQAEQAAQHQAEHDALTGLKSRACIERMLDQAVDAARRQDEQLTLLFIDLDGFKAVNDRHGHAAGDAVLVEAAPRLRAVFRRQDDLLGRRGGDELVVLLKRASTSDGWVAELAEQLIGRFATPFVLPGGQTARVGASIGGASYPCHAASAATLLEAADQAMYAVKQAGKGRFAVAQTPASTPLVGAGSVETSKIVSTL